jgi:hypothetical protein
MDEQRLQAYTGLIEQLLRCTSGQEFTVLQRHADLVDARLIAVMLKVADILEWQGIPNVA